MRDVSVFPFTLFPFHFSALCLVLMSFLCRWGGSISIVVRTVVYDAYDACLGMFLRSVLGSW